MKKILLIFTLVALTSGLIAQTNISVTISKVQENGKFYVQTTIKNNNPYQIIIFNSGMINEFGNYIKGSPSYFVFAGYKKVLFSNMLVKQTEDKLFPIAGAFAHKSMTNIRILPGGSIVDKRLIFEEEMTAFKVFAPGDKTSIKSMKLKVHLAYYYCIPTGGKDFRVDFTSNMLDL